MNKPIDLNLAKNQLLQKLRKNSWLRGVGIGDGMIEVRVHLQEDVEKVPKTFEGFTVNTVAIGNYLAYEGKK